MKTIIFCLSTTLLLVSCAAVEVNQKKENLFELKAWGSNKRSQEDLKASLIKKAKSICSPSSFEFVGDGFFDTKIIGLSQSIGGFDSYDPENITKTYTRHIRCLRTN